MDGWKLLVGGIVMAVGGGMVGAWVAAPPHAEAQAGFTRCFIARQESVDTDGSGSIEAPDSGHTINIPSGRTVVGGSGITATSYLGGILLCR